MPPEWLFSKLQKLNIFICLGVNIAEIILLRDEPKLFSSKFARIYAFGQAEASETVWASFCSVTENSSFRNRSL